MISREPIPKQPSTREFSAELDLDVGDMLTIAESAKHCFDLALERDVFIIADTQTFTNIPHSNKNMTTALQLSLKGRALSSIEIYIPKKDVSTGIRIKATDSSNPNRIFTFSEYTAGNSDIFFIDDSDSRNAVLANREVDAFIARDDVVRWLYRQLNYSPEEIVQMIKAETDPLQDAARQLQWKAEHVFTQRQIRVDISPELTLFGEEIDVREPDEIETSPLANPKHARDTKLKEAYPTRVYTVWLKSGFELDDANISQSIIATFSPDNPMLLLQSEHSNVRLELTSDTALPLAVLADLFQQQEKRYRGNIADMFNVVAEKIATITKDPKKA